MYFLASTILLLSANAISASRLLQPPAGDGEGPPQGGGGGDGGGGGVSFCSDSVADTISSGGSRPSTGLCPAMNSFEIYSYPDDFEVLSEVEQYICPTSQRRIFRSNGIPNHEIVVGNNAPCEQFWYVSLPLQPRFSLVGATELSPLGIIAMSLNGVPVFGPQEGGGTDANVFGVDVRGVPAGGHAARVGDWHYHAGEFGRVNNVEEISSNDLLGYALDGYPIYGPVEDADGMLDECNGMVGDDGSYQYHVRTFEQVDSISKEYCKTDGNPVSINWNYVLGCFSGDLSRTEVGDGATAELPLDCILVRNDDVLDLAYANSTAIAPEFGPGAEESADPEEDDVHDSFDGDESENVDTASLNSSSLKVTVSGTAILSLAISCIASFIL